MGDIDPGKFKSHDIEFDPESIEDFGVGGRGLERASNGPLLAIRNFFENQDEIKRLRQGDKALIKIIRNELVSWNEETLNLNLLSNEPPDKRLLTITETDIRDNLSAEHFIHTMNLNKICSKWTAIVNVSSRDDIQGGELIFRNWKDSVRYDNYGKVVGDDTCQPQWINELGTLIFIPSLEPWGHRLVVSGNGMKVITNFKGDSYK